MVNCKPFCSVHRPYHKINKMVGSHVEISHTKCSSHQDPDVQCKRGPGRYTWIWRYISIGCCRFEAYRRMVEKNVRPLYKPSEHRLTEWLATKMTSSWLVFSISTELQTSACQERLSGTYACSGNCVATTLHRKWFLLRRCGTKRPVAAGRVDKKGSNRIAKKEKKSLGKPTGDLCWSWVRGQTAFFNTRKIVLRTSSNDFLIMLQKQHLPYYKKRPWISIGPSLKRRLRRRSIAKCKCCFLNTRQHLKSCKKQRRGRITHKCWPTCRRSRHASSRNWTRLSLIQGSWSLLYCDACSCFLHPKRTGYVISSSSFCDILMLLSALDWLFVVQWLTLG